MSRAILDCSLLLGCERFCLCCLDGLLRHALSGVWPCKTQESCLWTLPGLYAHLLSGSMEALLVAAGGCWPFTYISSNPGFLSPDGRFFLMLLYLTRRRKSRHRHLECVLLYQVKLSLTMSTGNISVTEKKPRRRALHYGSGMGSACPQDCLSVSQACRGPC